MKKACGFFLIFVFKSIGSDVHVVWPSEPLKRIRITCNPFISEALKKGKNYLLKLEAVEDFTVNRLYAFINDKLNDVFNARLC